MTQDAAIRIAFGGLAPRRVDRLFERFLTPERVVSAIERSRVNVSERIRAAVAIDAGSRHRQLVEMGTTFRVAGETGYPERLLAYEGHPRWLFTRGTQTPAPSVGIVGTRACTAYGLELAELYGGVAAAHGWSVASGLARGIDGAAHRGATAAGGHCHAILGSGVDVIYPAGHRGLYETVLATGGMISSEYPPGTPPEAWRFPTRNRIIAGCSDVLLVVEAGLKGGALITARIALDYGVPVYAVPGDVDRSTSVGTNLLIRDGAFPVLGPDDFAEVLDLLNPLYGAQG
ncbi:MAG: DNA-processing protein DprA [Actinomycetota bacterium]